MEIEETDITVEQLAPTQAIPYEFLLLADPSRKMIDQYIFQSQIYIARHSSSIIGVYVLHAVGESDRVEIKNIAVKEEHQGKGIGKYLLQDAFQKAIKQGYKHIMIGTGNSSIGQLYLYQKLCFEIEEVKKAYFSKNYAEPIYENGLLCKDMIILAKVL